MEYALPSHNYHTTAELNGGDLFSMPLQQAAHDVQSLQPQATHTFGTEVLPSESQMSPIIASLNAQQKSHITQPAIQAQTTQKVKRQDDIWTGESFDIISQAITSNSKKNHFFFQIPGYLKKPMFYNGASYFQG